jgi:hypothetical protein
VEEHRVPPRLSAACCTSVFAGCMVARTCNSRSSLPACATRRPECCADTNLRESGSARCDHAWWQVFDRFAIRRQPHATSRNRPPLRMLAERADCATESVVSVPVITELTAGARGTPHCARWLIGPTSGACCARFQLRLLARSIIVRQARTYFYWCGCGGQGEGTSGKSTPGRARCGSGSGEVGSVSW